MDSEYHKTYAWSTSTDDGSHDQPAFDLVFGMLGDYPYLSYHPLGACVHPACRYPASLEHRTAEV